MKTYPTAPTCLMLAWLLMAAPVSGIAQSDNPKIAADLALISRQMEAGIYERIINLGYIPSPKQYKQSEPLIAHNEFTLLFLRFSGFESVLSGTAYVGRVFMSERYVEKDYNRKYRNRAAYETDKDGFFMACKLYFDERTLEYRLNIYPDHLLNICRGSGNSSPFKGMHFNKAECTGTTQHWASLKYVVALTDKHYDNFSDENDIADIRRFLNSVPSSANLYHNYLHSARPALAETDDEDELSPSTADLTQRQKNMLREINLRKQIKYFRVDPDPDKGAAQLAASLTLRFTKYALSEDLLDNTTYTYTFIPRDSLIDSQLAHRGRERVFVSRNPLYRSIMSSPVPDDKYIPGIELPKSIALDFEANSILNSSTPDKTQPAPPAQNQYIEAINKVQQRQDSAQLSQLERKQEQSVKQIQVLKEQPNTARLQELERQQQRQQQEVQQRQQQQQQQQMVSGSTVAPIRVSSPGTSDTSWVYGGRILLTGKRSTLPLIGKPYQMPANQFLRDTIPELARPNLYKKGKVKFGVDKGVARKGSSWLVAKDTLLNAEPTDNYQYRWLQIRPAPKRD
jgi:hypothetical protein